MSVFLDLPKLLTSSPGGMVYYLVLLFSVWAIVGLSLSRWSRGERREIVPRILVAGALMSFSRFVPIVIALLDRQGGTSLVLVGPPLERFIDTLSGLLVCWAFVISDRQRRAGRVLIGVTSLFSAGLYVIAATQWARDLQIDPSALYNLSWQRWAWELWQLSFLVPALAYLSVSPVQDRGTLIVSLSVLAVGHLLQAAFPFAEDIPYFAGWTRFANLLAFPLLAVSTYRLIVQRFDMQAASLQMVNQESLSQITGLMAILDTNRRMSSSLDLDAVLDSAVRRVSQALQSNLCALALYDTDGEPDPSGDMELSVVYNALRVTRGHTQFYAKEYPTIRYAIARNRPVVLDPGGSRASARARAAGKSDQVTQVYRLLESEQSGPLIVQPLEHESAVAGVILVCRPGQSAPFTSAEARKCEALATHLVAVIQNARGYQQAEERIQRLTDDVRLLKTEHSRSKADLENRLKQTRDEVTLYIQKLYETELSETRAENDAEDVRQKLAKLQKQSEDEIAHAGAELQHSIEQVTRLTKQLAELDFQCLELNDRVQALDQEKRELQFQLAVEASVQPDLTLDAQEAQPGGREGRAEELDFTILDHMGCGVILCDQRGQITHINAAGARLLGREVDQWVGESAFALWDAGVWQSALHSATDQYSIDTLHPAGESDAASSPPIAHQAESPRIEPFSIESNGDTIRVELAPLRVAERHVGAVVTLHAVQQVDERVRARDEFLASLAQDLRTPMTSILGYTELLMNESVGKLRSIQRKFLQRVQANVERMRGMLNDLIGVTAIDSGQLSIELAPVDIVHVIETALRKVQFRLEEKQLGTELKGGDLPVVFADPECVQQIMDNLLTNACKSSQVGTTIGIQAHAETEDTGKSHLHVAVSDTGGGIAPEDRARVFERFYRPNSALVAGRGETGVGLAIVKSLVEAHQGQVWHESEMGVGTTFHFTLPLGLQRQTDNGMIGPSVVERHAPGGDGRG